VSEPLINVELEGPIASLVLARPAARNAMTVEMGKQVSDAVKFIARSPARVVIVRGAGPCFSAGGDLGFLEERLKSNSAENHQTMRRFYDDYLSIRTLQVPTIAALHGAAIGAGLCFAMACDMRLCAEGTKLAVNFVKLGLHPGMGATWFLPRLVGPARAAELLMTGRTVDAGEAFAIGLVNELTPGDGLVERARELAKDIAAAGPLAVMQVKQSLTADSAAELNDLLEVEATAQAMNYSTKDLAEGVRAVKEKRAPKFIGA
jgi:enoyl-CoA hydratase/carnithine racemase